MASRYRCVCGAVIFTNLFSGNGVHLLLAEEVLDREDGAIAPDFIHALIQASNTVAICPHCHRLAVIDSEYRIHFYIPEEGAP